MAGDWRISADERIRYESFFQQCGPIQGFLTGDQARDFFIKSNLPGDILRKIWDLADVTADGRLDAREFIIACHLISSQVQKKGPLPATLPPSLLSDSVVTANGIRPVTTSPLTVNASTKPAGLNSILLITPAIRSKYLQQFHSLVDVTKTNGLMNGLQAKNILQQTGLSYTLLHQIWDLSDYDKDGCLSADEFIIAMHCCDIARTGQPLPTQFPDEWLIKNQQLNERKESDNRTVANTNQPLKETINLTKTPETEAERKSAMATYEEKRLKNYEDGNRELERRRQLLREQEEREQREREERERKREFELQKQKEEQERKKQIEIERQLERQRQIEQQKEEERRKLHEQREAARKEMERKSRLEWERQRMQELSTQKTRLLDQINDLKSREKAFELELESMDDTLQTSQTKISQIEAAIHTTDESIAEVQRNIMTEKSLFDNAEQTVRELKTQLNTVQAERESLDSSLKELNQSIEFGMNNREADQIKYLQVQIETMKEENTQVDEQITTLSEQCKEYQNQMEQLRVQLDQIEQEMKAKQPKEEEVTFPTNPPVEFANFDQFNANIPTNDQITDDTIPPPTLPPAVVDVDPFQTVDPFASHSDISSTTANNDWFQPSKDDPNSATVDPFLPKVEPISLPTPVATALPAAVQSPKIKKAAPKANPTNKVTQKPPVAADPWGESTTNTNGNSWAQFNNNSNNTDSPFGATTDWPQTTNVSNENSTKDIIQYRALYDYTPERPDEMAITIGDIIIVDPTKQQDEDWLFGQIGQDRQGFFPVVYAERIASTPTNTVDTTSQLASGSWVITLADYQGKTADKHLSFQKGELILVREQKDATWYSGQMNDKVGWFPRNHVRPATNVEIENNKNLTKTTSIDEQALSTPTATDKSSNNVDNTDVFEAIYAYEATHPSDLSFEVGERIIVLKREENWWTGRIGDRIGLFPNNYVEPVNHIIATAVAIKPNQSTEEDHLSFETGQMIYIIQKNDKEFYQGEIRLPDHSLRVGWFPADCVQIQENDVSSASLNQTASYPKYMSIFPYEAQHDDELSFPADATLEILHEASAAGWFTARLGDQVGLIPATYVQPIESHNQPPSIPSQLPSNPMPCTPMTIDSSQHPLCDNTTLVSVDNSSTLTINTSSHKIPNISARISAIRELIETEQRYVNDLRLVANAFIKPLTNGRILNDYEIEQLFSNWFNVIACNSVFLSTLEAQVQNREHISTVDVNVPMREPRSVSMSNVATITSIQSIPIVEQHPPRSVLSHIYDSPPVHRLTYHVEIEHDSSSLSDNIVPQSCDSSSSTTTSSSMIINDSTRIGEILGSYLPYMADTYFEYCNCRSQANKYLQSKIDLNEQFRSHVNIFQNNNGGLSLNGFLTKPIQRVTRYPLLIEKILKNTPINHPDYRHIQQALECSYDLTKRINKQISEQENCLRLDWLQQHVLLINDESSSDGYVYDELLKFNSMTRFHRKRELLLHGLLIKVPSGKELITFLFNDFLLFSTTKVSSNNWQSQLFESKSNLQLKLYRLPLLLSDVISVQDLPNDPLIFSITARTYEKPFILKTQQTNLRTLWVRTINNAIENYHQTEKLILNDKILCTTTDQEHELRSPTVRLVLLIVEARDLLLPMANRERHRSLNPYCEITVGTLTLKTPYVKGTNNPKWNTSMEFLIYDMVDDVIHVNIFDNEFFSPNENLGHTSMHLIDILPCEIDAFLTQSLQTFPQTIYLNNGAALITECTIQFLQ